jgi:hypothetical protein
MTNFAKERRQAFLRGLLKGLAAPALLFRNLSVPSARTDYIQPSGGKSAEDAIMGDWQRVSDDMRKVIDRMNMPPAP